MSADLRSPNQIAISQGLKFAWKRRKREAQERMTAAEYKATAKPKKPKYGNRKVVVDGVLMDSKREAARLAELLLLQREGRISGLKRQPTFTLAASVSLAGEKRAKPAIKYTADFSYMEESPTGGFVVEDVKSPSTAKTAAFRIKLHLMKSVHGIDVRIVR